MPGFRFHNPVEIRFGWGVLDTLGSALGERRAALVTFPEARRLGITARVEALIGERLTGVVEDVPVNPDTAWLRGCLGREPLYGADVVVAVGGGSVLDSAKVLRAGGACGGFDGLMAKLIDGAAPPSAVPMIAVPTTAGTGSEVTPWATVWRHDGDSPKKYSLSSPQLWAEQALLDPELTLSQPSHVMRNSALDALSHALESIWNVNANPVSDALAVSAARAILSALSLAWRTPSDRAAREILMKASLQAGLAFSATRTALAHSLSYPLTLSHGLPHGLACSFTLPLVWRLAAGVSAERDQVLARIFGEHEVSPDLRLGVFLESVGVATTFAAHGIAADEARCLIEDAARGERGRNFIHATPAARAVSEGLIR